eukprot:15720-Heterococcus_DN1.PRE.3
MVSVTLALAVEAPAARSYSSSSSSSSNSSSSTSSSVASAPAVTRCNSNSNSSSCAAMSDSTDLQQIALLEQKLTQAHAEKALQQDLLAAKEGELRAQRAALVAKDSELQALRALISARAACGSADAVSGSTTASSPEEQRKRVCVVDDSSVRSPLDKDEILDEVFSYVGVGDYFFVAGVCRKWRDRYLQYCCRRAAASTWLSEACKTNTTYKSAFMTAARLQLAFQCGLDLEGLHEHEWLSHDIASYSIEPIEALIVAKTYDMRYPDDLARAAAFNGRLQLLQWLHEHRCHWPESLVLVNAAGSDS